MCEMTRDEKMISNDLAIQKNDTVKFKLRLLEVKHNHNFKLIN